MIFNLEKHIAKKINSGYWKCQEKVFFNKSDCLRYASSCNTREEITYHFFDECFANQDWKNDCQDSLEDLYKKRALQLREKYDYLVLAYSGGSDSSNILETFLGNNIKLDEICTYYPVTVSDRLQSRFDINNKHASNAIFEYNQVVVPRFKELEKTHPGIKLTVLDYTQKSLELIKTEQLMNVSMAGIGPSLQFSGPLMVSERVRTISEKIKKVGCIYGVDKPRLIFDPRQKKICYLVFRSKQSVWSL